MIALWKKLLVIFGVELLAGIAARAGWNLLKGNIIEIKPRPKDPWAGCIKLDNNEFEVN